MRTSQWSILSLFCTGMAIFFTKQDSFWGKICREIPMDSPLIRWDIVACVNAEIYEPFIWILFPLGILFIILGVMEHGKNKKGHSK